MTPDGKVTCIAAVFAALVAAVLLYSGRRPI